MGFSENREWLFSQVLEMRDLVRNVLAISRKFWCKIYARLIRDVRDFYARDHLSGAVQVPKEDPSAKIVEGFSPEYQLVILHTCLIVRTSRYFFSIFSREQACETRLGSREKTHSPVSHSLAARSRINKCIPLSASLFHPLISLCM